MTRYATSNTRTSKLWHWLRTTSPRSKEHATSITARRTTYVGGFIVWATWQRLLIKRSNEYLYSQLYLRWYLLSMRSCGVKLLERRNTPVATTHGKYLTFFTYRIPTHPYLIQINVIRYELFYLNLIYVFIWCNNPGYLN